MYGVARWLIKFVETDNAAQAHQVIFLGWHWVGEDRVCAFESVRSVWLAKHWTLTKQHLD